MAAPATAPKPRRPRASRSAAARAAPARPAPRRAPARRRQATPLPGRLVPIAAARTAGAVGGLADSGLVVRLTRGRLWIAALGALLVGIVALNVLALSLSSSSTDTARAVERLETEASSLRSELAERLSTERVQQVAATVGLAHPEPGDIGYLRASSEDAAEAARRLRSGELTAIAYSPPVATDLAEPAIASAAEAATAPATEAESEAGAEAGAAPAPAATGEADPAAGEPASTAPAPDGAGSAGGVAPP